MLSAATMTFAQVSDAPRFEQFPATEKFSGKPAAPVLKTSGDRGFRTMIREGAAKGPNFAGYLTIATWGCGASCIQVAVIDARTGQINHDLPEYFTADAGSAEPLSYKRESRLLILHGCPREKNCAVYYYEWTGTKFKLLSK
jgi:hypothetical protein